LYTTPIHVRRRQISATLSPELLEEYKTHSIQVREGDTVTIIRGNFAGVEGKVTRVDTKKFFLYIEGVTRERTDGTSVPVPIHPSKVMIKNLNLGDKRRKKILERRGPPKSYEKNEKPKAMPKKRSKGKGEEKSILEEKE